MRLVKDPEKRLLLAANRVVKDEHSYPLPEHIVVAPSVLAEVWVCVGKEDLHELKEALANYKLWKEGQS